MRVKPLNKCFCSYFCTGYTEEASFILSKHNSFNLCHNGYGFKKHRTTPKGAIYWYCKKQNTLKCKVKAYTKQFGTRDMVRIVGDHNHQP